MNKSKLSTNAKVSDITFSECEVYRNEVFLNSSFENSNINFPIFYGCRFVNCKFKTCDLNNSKFFEQNEFEDCEFTSCDMRNIGVGKDGLFFKKTKFHSCDMRGMGLEATKFSECDFEKCKIIATTFFDDKIEKCSINTKLVDIKFKGGKNGALDIDFKKSNLYGVDFLNTDLSKSIPPKTKDHYYVDDLPLRCSKALAKLKSDIKIDEDIKKILCRRIGKLSENKNYIFNYKFIKDVEGSDFAKIFFDILEIIPSEQQNI